MLVNLLYYLAHHQRSLLLTHPRMHQYHQCLPEGTNGKDWEEFEYKVWSVPDFRSL
jgi:hypothetical protein